MYLSLQGLIIFIYSTLSTMTITTTEMSKNSRFLVNHALQCTQFGSPIIFIDSFKRACFSKNQLLINYYKIKDGKSTGAVTHNMVKKINMEQTILQLCPGL